MTISYQTIINEINQVPVSMLNDVYNMVHSFNLKVVQKQQNRDEIMNFAGCWEDMKQEDFNDFMDIIKTERNNMFNREIEF